MDGVQVLKMIEENHIEFIDFRFVDLLGKHHHITYPADQLDVETFQSGKMFDGSSIAGWKSIHESDMVLRPDPSSVIIDPFCEDPTLVLLCDAIEPSTMQPYSRDPRSLAKRAEVFLKETGIADTAFFGPEPEFFVFDAVHWENNMQSTGFRIESEEGCFSSNKRFEEGNAGHRPGVKGGYFPVPPVDSLQDLRSEMCKVLTSVGIPVEVHHHEVATAGQCEVGTRFNTLTRKADELILLKYIVKNVAHRHGKTATFMPKPLVGDNGSGMHIHQSLSKTGQNLFAGDGYSGLSQQALWYIGGIFKHARAINAFANSTTNSYKRLVPGFEAPVMLAYSARNRSASCRIPWVSTEQARRIEMRFPDAMNSGYLTFSALLMAGLDGIRNQIDPGLPTEKDLYALSPDETKMMPTVCQSLDQALDALDQDRDFLKAGDVFSDDIIDGYIALKMQELTRYRAATHPVEFDMYYAV